MKKALAAYGLLLGGVVLLSIAFFRLDHRAMPNWLYTLISVALAVAFGLLIYFLLRQFRR